MTTIKQRVDWYNRANPERPPLSGNESWVTGTWLIGACYKNPNKLYGSYPYGYLGRVHVMFPDARRVLHVFSGGMTLGNALATYYKTVRGDLVQDSLGTYRRHPLETMVLVDAKGPDDGRHPTHQGDVCHLPEDWAGRFDLVLADPPYSAADAEKYGHPMPNVGAVMRELRRVTVKGGNLVWLATQWPLHRKSDWKTWGHVGLVRSMNHRMRLVSMFEAV